MTTIYLCSDATALQQCISQWPAATRWLVYGDPAAALATALAGSAPLTTLPIPPNPAPLSLTAPLLVCVAAHDLPPSAQVDLAVRFSALALAEQPVVFAPAALSLAGQTGKSAPHAALLPATVALSHRLDSSTALAEALHAVATSGHPGLLLDDTVWVRYDSSDRSLVVAGTGSVLLAAPLPAAPGLPSATFDVLTAGQRHLL